MSADGNFYRELKPHAVRIRDAQTLLGGKARSEIYRAVGQGNLIAVKDGRKTLILTSSIAAYVANLPPAKIKVQSPKRLRGRKTRTREGGV
jgi:hypothetical protein